jgi:PBP1b-binding outer membrane lipoprotein LpoB
MKKILSIAALFLIITSCNNSTETETAKVDSLGNTGEDKVDSLEKRIDTLKNKVDSTFESKIDSLKQRKEALKESFDSTKKVRKDSLKKQ